MHVLVIGSSVIDLFLSVDKNHVKTSNEKIILNLGDKIPSNIRKLALGGNGANVSVGLTRLEVPITFYTWLGNDILSREIERGLTREGVELAAKRSEQESSSLSIIFDFDSDRIIFSHHEVRDYTFDPDLLGVNFDYIFLTSIGDRWERAYEQVFNFSQKNNIPIAFSPGVRQLENISETIQRIVASSKIYFSNREEALKIRNSNIELRNGEDMKKLLLEIKNMGPEIVSITDGASGAYAIDSNNNCFKIGPAPSSGHEKTGAGDAYAAGFFASFLSGREIPTCMQCGSLSSQAVMDQIGAQAGLLDKKTLDECLSKLNNLKAEKI